MCRNDHEGLLTECKVRLVANEVLLRLTSSRVRNNYLNEPQGEINESLGGRRGHVWTSVQG